VHAHISKHQDATAAARSGWWQGVVHVHAAHATISVRAPASASVTARGQAPVLSATSHVCHQNAGMRALLVPLLLTYMHA
jgi:hypothetical protein